MAFSGLDSDRAPLDQFCEGLAPPRPRSTGARTLPGPLPLRVAELATPLGALYVAGSSKAIYLIEFQDRPGLQRQFAHLADLCGAVFEPGQTECMHQLEQELADYFQGRLRRFHTPVRFSGTPHQEAVWHALCQIPHGRTVSYGAVAEQIGRPRSARAVGRTVGLNRLSIVVPCHRVVGSNGTLTGYASGLERKRFLLELETSTPFS